MLAGGVVALTAGAGRFVEGAVRLSRSLGVSTILIGALVVGLGTSLPELVVSGLAAGRGELDLAVGNVVGSNVANVTFVLGAAALVAPFATHRLIIRREGGLMLAVVSLLTLLLWDERLLRGEATLLLIAMVVATWALTRWSRGDGFPGVERSGGLARGAVHSIVGMAATLGGAELLVRGATRLAEELDITTAFVGLVIVAIGTSLPEAATAITAARRGEADLVVGNVLGSNIFNSLVVAGTAGVIGPGRIEGAFHAGAVFMIAAAAVAGLFQFTGWRLTRLEGVALFASFGLFSVLVV